MNPFPTAMFPILLPLHGGGFNVSLGVRFLCGCLGWGRFCADDLASLYAALRQELGCIESWFMVCCH